MLSYVAALIAASLKNREAFPPHWYQALADTAPPFPPFWLDRIINSRILTDFSGNLHRRGLYVNTEGKWQLLSLLHIFTDANAPVWLAYPKGGKPVGDYERLLAPRKQVIEGICLWSQQSQAGPARAPPLQQQQSSGHNLPGPDFDFNPNAQAAKMMTEMASIRAFLKCREELNAGRNMRQYSPQKLASMHERQKDLVLTSKVFVWEEIEMEPWLVCTRVVNADKRPTFDQYAANQRSYDIFTDEWDLFDNIDPIEDIDCNIPGYRQEGHDHTAQLEPNEYPVVSLPQQVEPHLCPIATYRDNIAATQGEWALQSYSRMNMDPFLVVAHYRYGIQNLPPSPLRLDIAPQPFSVPQDTVLLLRAIGQEPALFEPEFRNQDFIQHLQEFWNASRSNQTMPLAVSDCHMNPSLFKAKYNRWGLTDITPFEHFGVMTFPIRTITSDACGWTLAFTCKSTLR